MKCPECGCELIITEETFKKTNTTLLTIALLFLNIVANIFFVVSKIVTNNIINGFQEFLLYTPIVFLIILAIQLLKAVYNFMHDTKIPTSRTKLTCIVCNKKWYI